MVDLGLEEALAGYDAQEGDIIKSQEAFAVYTNENKWEGDLKTLSVGKGYMLKRAEKAQPTEFYYPTTTKRNGKRDNRSRVNRKFADNMNIIGIINDGMVNDGDSIIAVVQGENRGASNLQNNEKVFLTVQGDYAADVKLLLKREDKVIAKARNKITFEKDSVVGSMKSPIEISFESITEMERIHVTPTIVENELSVVINDESMQKVEVYIYAADGVVIRKSKEDAVSNGHYMKSFTLSDIAPGVYLVKIVINNESNIVRIIKK